MKNVIFAILMIFSFTVVGQGGQPFFPYKKDNTAYTQAEITDLFAHDPSKLAFLGEQIKVDADKDGWSKFLVSGPLQPSHVVWLMSYMYTGEEEWKAGDYDIYEVAKDGGFEVMSTPRASHSVLRGPDKKEGPEKVLILDPNKIPGITSSTGIPFPSHAYILLPCGNVKKGRKNISEPVSPVAVAKPATTPVVAKPADALTIPTGGTVVINNNYYGQSQQQAPVQQMPTQMQAQYETGYYDDGTQYQKLVGYVQVQSIQSELYPIGGQYVNTKPQQQQQQAQTVNVNVEQPKKSIWGDIITGAAIVGAALILDDGNRGYSYGGGYNNTCTYCGHWGCNGSCRWNQPVICGYCGRHNCNGGCQQTVIQYTPVPNVYGDGWGFQSTGEKFFYPR